MAVLSKLSRNVKGGLEKKLRAAATLIRNSINRGTLRDCTYLPIRLPAAPSITRVSLRDKVHAFQSDASSKVYSAVQNYRSIARWPFGPDHGPFFWTDEEWNSKRRQYKGLKSECVMRDWRYFKTEFAVIKKKRKGLRRNGLYDAEAQKEYQLDIEKNKWELRALRSGARITILKARVLTWVGELRNGF